MAVTRIKVVDQVYEMILEMILDGRLPPGSRIDYNDLGEQFETSRVPLREAVQRLVSEGLLAINARGGTYVSELNPSDISFLFRLRLFLEQSAVKDGFEKIDRDKLRDLKKVFEAEAADIARDGDYRTSSSIFRQDLALHREIVVEATGNQIVEHIAGIVYNYTQLAQKMNTRIRSSNQEHLEIINAILENDKERTLKALEVHLTQVEESILKSFD